MHSKSPRFNLIKNLFIKLLIIVIAGIIYTVVAATNNNFTHNKPLGVCVFDIDYTLKCKGAYAAVEACKNAGFDLAINTARNKQDAEEVIYDGTLISKGFSPEFVEIAKNQKKLNGPFQYRESWSFKQSEEQKFQNKSYGMRQISEYYNIRTDDIESRRLVLFDDMLHNIIQMQPNELEPYSSDRCKSDGDGVCYRDPHNSFFKAVYPRNWKIYRSKWVGHFCTRWDDPEIAASDAMEMISDVIEENERDKLTKEVLDLEGKDFNNNH